MNRNPITDQDIKRSAQINQQVERWDLFAKLAPVIFLVTCFALLASNSVSFDTVFTIGMILFSLTAVTWWFWAIFSIRFLVNTLSRAGTNLVEVSNDLAEAKKELKELINEEDNSSKRN